MLPLQPLAYPLFRPADRSLDLPVLPAVGRQFLGEGVVHEEGIQIFSRRVHRLQQILRIRQPVTDGYGTQRVFCRLLQTAGMHEESLDVEELRHA